jgi:hypothetical protein
VYGGLAVDKASMRMFFLPHNGSYCGVFTKVCWSVAVSQPHTATVDNAVMNLFSTSLLKEWRPSLASTPQAVELDTLIAFFPGVVFDC